MALSIIARPRLVASQNVGEDIFVGSKHDLIDAGLARDGQFPGDPGRGRSQTTLDATGNPVRQGSHERDLRTRAGMVEIRRVGRDRYRLAVRVGHEEHQRRLDAAHAERRRNEAHARAVAAHDRILAEREHDPGYGPLAVGDHALLRDEHTAVRVVRGYGPHLMEPKSGGVETRIGYVLFNGHDIQFAPAHRLVGVGGEVLHVRRAT